MRDATPARSGIDVTVVGSFSEEIPNGASQVSVGGLIDGRIVLAVAPPPRVTKTDVTLRRAQLGLLSPKSGRIDLVTDGTYAGPPRQITGADANDAWLVWSETSSTDLFSDPWVLFAYNIHTRRTHEITRATPNQDGQYPTAKNGLHARLGHDGRVYFAAQTGPGRRAPTGIYSVPVAGEPQRRLEVKAGWSPVISSHTLYYITKSGARKKALSGRATASPALPTQQSVCETVDLAASGDHIAAVQRCGKNAQTIVWDATGEPVTIDGPAHQPIGYLRISQSYVAFATGSGPYKQYVFVFDDHKLLSIGKGMLGGDMPGAGSTFSWTSYANPRAAGVEHITQLR